MKTYFGKRLPEGCKVYVLDETRTERVRELPLRLDLANHSPTGFQWGYQGSGPAQLALAILCDALEDDTLAHGYHQRFKSEVIAKLEGDVWFLHDRCILLWAARAGQAEQANS